MEQVKNEISQIVSEEIDKCIIRFQSKICKAIKNMEENESIDDYDFDIKSFVDRSTTSILNQLETVINKIEKPKKKKTKRDPNAPKKPRTAYILFSSDNRVDVKKENPDMIPTDITKEVARMWREADEDVKEEYKEKAEEDKKRYQDEMEIYNPEYKQTSSNDKKEKPKEKKDPNAPKKPCSAYILFSSDHRKQAKEENPELSTVELTKKLAEMWKEASQKTKDKYEAKALDDKKRYETEMIDYNKEKESKSTKEDDEDEEKESPKESKKEKKGNKEKDSPKESKKEKKENKEKDSPKESKKEKKELPKESVKKSSPLKKQDTKKKSANPFMNFVNEKRPLVVEENPDAKSHEITKMLADLWKDLSDEEKAEYK